MITKVFMDFLEFFIQISYIKNCYASTLYYDLYIQDLYYAYWIFLFILIIAEFSTTDFNPGEF